MEGSERQRIPSTGARGVGLTAAADAVCQKLRQVMQGATLALRDRQITGCSRCRLTQSVLQGKAGGCSGRSYRCQALPQTSVPSRHRLLPTRHGLQGQTAGRL